MVRKRLSARQREELRKAFWSAEDTTRTQVPDTYEGRLAYERESISSQILNAVHEYMAEHEITQHALATQLGVSEGRVSQVLSGEQNLTLRTLAAIAAALKAHFDIQLVPTVGGSWEQPEIELTGPSHGAPAPEPVPVPPASPVPAEVKEPAMV